MISNQELLRYMDELLQAKIIEDYCPNGLQVQGKEEIHTIVSGVTACQALLDKAVEVNADAIIVHHGYFWRGESPVVAGIAYNRISTLIKNNINLFTYHLPLDLHPKYGNNVMLGKVLDIKIVDRKPLIGYEDLTTIGEFKQPVSGNELAELLEIKLQRKPLYVKGSSKPIKRVAWCTGAAQNYIIEAASYDVDAYITGEISEQTFHLANELGIHFYAAGHHATEIYGVKALSEHIADKFKLQHHFIDVDNPV